MIQTVFCGLKLRNPFFLASGILGTNCDLLLRVYSAGAGAVTTKSIGPKERFGNKNPCVIELKDGIINCVGLPSPGYLNMEEEFEALKRSKIPVVYSVYGNSIEDYVKITKFIIKYKPAIIELNISCPNKADGMTFGKNKKLAYNLVKEVKKVSKNIPIMPKLTPNCENIGEIAASCEKAGADAISAINTVLAKNKDLSMGQGGLSGPIIHKKALECVSKISKKVKIPILGIGGVTTGKDALNMLKAGASAVGIGAGVHFRGIEIFSEIIEELKSEMKKEGYNSIKDIGDDKNGCCS